MSKPTAPTEIGASKVMFGADSTAVTPVAYAPAAIQSSLSGEATYPVGWLGFATHREGDTLTTPGGFTSLATAFAPVVLVAGKDGTTVRSVAVNADGEIGVHDGGNSLTVDGSITVASGTIAATQSGTWTIVGISGTISLPTGAATSALQTQPGVDIGDVTINNAAGAAAVNIQDGGNSITVDGAVTVSGTAAVTQSGTWNITNISGTISLPTGAATSALQTQPGVDIGDVTINNASGASAVNIQDGGNSITVDGTVAVSAVSGTVAATQSGTWNIATLTTITNVVHVDDNAGSLTVDGTVAISGTVTVASHAVTNAGTFAVQDSQVVTDNAAFTDGTTKVFAAGYIYDEVAGTALTENDIGAARMNVNRALVSAIEDGVTRARYATVTATNALKVDGSAVTQPVSGTVTANAGTNLNTSLLALESGGNVAAIANILNNTIHSEDAPSASGDVGFAMLSIQKATPADLAAEADYAFLQMSAGRLWTSTKLDTAIPAGSNNIGDVDVLTVPAPLSTTGGGTEATALRVTIASNSTGLLPVTPGIGLFAANTAILATGVSVTTAATKLPATALANRRRLFIQNTGTASIFVGSSAVTASGAARGIEVQAYGNMELEIGPSVDVYGIVATGSQTANVLELS